MGLPDPGPPGGQLDYWVKSAASGGVAYAVQPAVNGEFQLLIFVPPAAHSHDLAHMMAKNASDAVRAGRHVDGHN
jgi:hypothetical protein